MLEIKLILCPIDFSGFSVRAYRHALSLAEHYRAKLVALHVVELWRHPSVAFTANAGLYDEFCQAVCEGGKEQLQKFVQQNTHNEIQPELLVHQGIAADSILSLARAHKADVIVMGTHGRRGYDRLMLGSVTDRVMRMAPCPVLVVNNLPNVPESAVNQPGQAHRLTRVLFCTDFSENSKRALDYAISAAQEYNAELTLVHVLEDAPSPARKGEALAAATEQLEKLMHPEMRKTLKIKTAVRIGKPYREIIQFALEAPADIVIMGVHGRGVLDLAVFGSTTYRVMQLGPCPVLAVHV
jgi:nucleotide-binding universal stress UspA family protein